MKTMTPEDATRLVQDAEKMSKEEISKLQRQRLVELVRYVRAHSPFFQKHYANLPEDPKLEELPIIDKRGLMADYNSWVTNPRIRLTELRSWAQKKEDFYLDAYTHLTTSGTTGEPMPMLRDSCHNNIHGAMLRLRLLRGGTLSLDPSRYRIASVIATDPSVSSYSSFCKIQKQRPEYAANMIAISPQQPTKIIRKKLHDFQPQILTGYPSSITLMALEQLQGRLAIAPEWIAVSAETMSYAAYKTIEKAFGCPILNNYCSTEAGEAAMSCREGRLHINEDWVIIEPINEKKHIVAPGEMSNGILVTDLSNYVQPIIRYHVNDAIRLLPGCNCGSPFQAMEIMGRSYESLEINGKQLPFTPLWDIAASQVPGALVFQFAQTDPHHLCYRFVLDIGVDREAYCTEIRQAVRKYLRDAGLGKESFFIDHHLPRTSKRGGKVTNFVEEYEPIISAS